MRRSYKLKVINLKVSPALIDVCVCLYHSLVYVYIEIETIEYKRTEQRKGDNFSCVLALRPIFYPKNSLSNRRDYDEDIHVNLSYVYWFGILNNKKHDDDS